MIARSTWMLLVALGFSIILLVYAWDVGEAATRSSSCWHDWICAGDYFNNFCNPDPGWGCDNGPFCLSWCCTCAGPG